MATAYNFQLGILPERKISWRTLVSSYGLLVLFILAILSIGLIWPERLELKKNFHITELIPLPATDVPKPMAMKQPKVVAKLLPKVPIPVFEAPKLVLPREIRAPRERQQPEEAPKVLMNNFQAANLVQTAGGARAAKLIHTGEFGSSATPTVNAPIQKVQTGGFGDPNGLKGTGKEGAHLQAAQLGSFEMPQGPGTGNGTGGANGIKGTVASAGFGNGIAQPGQGDGRSNGRGVATGGFGTQEVAKSGPVARAVETGPATSSVEVTYKPNPVYTDEARQLKLQGEVLLEVMFGANGQLHVNRVVRGLGHGLDEAAVTTASKMRFKPAMRAGTPVDFTAVVHVVFQLAN
jgi:TonB family protein